MLCRVNAGHICGAQIKLPVTTVLVALALWGADLLMRSADVECHGQAGKSR